MIDPESHHGLPGGHDRHQLATFHPLLVADRTRNGSSLNRSPCHVILANTGTANSGLELTQLDERKAERGGIRTPGGCYTTPVFKTGELIPELINIQQGYENCQLRLTVWLTGIAQKRR